MTAFLCNQAEKEIGGKVKFLKGTLTSLASFRQAEKLKSREMKDEGWRGVLLTDRPTNRQTDICDCRIAFATEKERWKENFDSLFYVEYTCFYSFISNVISKFPDTI